MFKEERVEIDAQEKTVDIFREFLDLSMGLKLQKKSQFSISNDHFVKFKMFEILQSKTGPVEINSALIKRINTMSNQQSFFSMGQNQS